MVNKFINTPTNIQIIAKINEIIDNLGGGGGSVSIDGTSITQNASSQLQAIGLIASGIASGALKFVVCTQAEYNAMASHDATTLYIISDDLVSGNT